MRAGEPTFAAKAAAAWGERVPDWVAVLAGEADRTSGRAAAARIGYSTAVVSTVLNGRYAGSLDIVEERVRGALMGSVVECPVWGEIGRDRCLTEQTLPFSATSSARAQCYRACRSGCRHSRLPNEAAHRDGRPGKDVP